MNLPDNHIFEASGSTAEKLWKKGYGVIKHSSLTQKRIKLMLEDLRARNKIPHGLDPYELLIACDRITSAAMWLVVHSTYVNQVYLDGRELEASDFKKEPEGHTGGSLNVTPGYVAYMALNALTGKTRAWTMEQGHAVAAIDSVNLLLGNMKKQHSERYSLSDTGLTKFVQDFYAFKLSETGKQESPRGSHVNHYTGGGNIEGGYLGFAGVQYVHIPLPGERLICFLSDGAFEEQKGGDWAPRFWRAEDSGLVMPIMILNGRRIDQRSTLIQEGGPEWLAKYLKLHQFDPIIFDGRDPAAFLWAIYEMERRLKSYIRAAEGPHSYPAPLPYGIAVAPKGAGFYGEGTNAAHNLPLVLNPYNDELTRERFNYHAKKLWVDEKTIHASVKIFNNHEKTKRIKEKDHPIANRVVTLKNSPEMQFKEIDKAVRSDLEKATRSCPMQAIDLGFVAIAEANNHLRPRIGNPDEIRSNRMNETLESFKFRAEKPEGGNMEAVDGAVVTVLNEEAIAGAVFGNKGGINILVTYEAFGAKVFGEARQEVIFAQHLKESGQGPHWLSVPLVMASHAWENGKNEQSHQDPSMAEAMFGEMADISRVMFPPDYNTSAIVISEVYKTQGQVWTIVASKRNNHDIFTADEARQMYADGGIRLSWFEYKPEEAKIALIAVGAYQLIEVIKAANRLKDADIPVSVACLLEPGKFRTPRSKAEAEHMASSEVKNNLLLSGVEHVGFVVHTRPEILTGALNNWFGKRSVTQFGFLNHGGTLDADGLMFVNNSSWAHILRDACSSLGIDEDKVFNVEEREALDGKRSPDGVIRGK